MSTSYELAGKVKLVQEAQTFDSGFTKREIVVTVEDGKYPQDISLDFVQDKVALLDDVKDGDGVEITFNIRGREYNGRYFNNLQGWKLNIVSAGAPSFGDQPPVSDKDVPDVLDEDDIGF